MLSLKEIVKEISKASDLPENEVSQKIEEKQTELSGLVSPEGAAYIVGKELGVNLLKESTKRRLKIKNVIPGMRSVDIVGRIAGISDRRDFEKEGRKGSVVNVTLGDETGITRLSMWDNEIELLTKLDMKEGDVVKVTGGYVKENGMGGSEIRLGKTGKLERSDVKITEIKDIMEGSREVRMENICDLKEGGYSKIRASLVQVFRRNPFFEVCPTCESRLEKEGDVWKCKDHGRVEPNYNLVLSGVADDGSGNIRVVFFRELVERVWGKDVSELRKIASDDPLRVYEDLELGEEFIIRGRVKKNQFTDRMELVANDVQKVDPKEEAEKVIKKIEGIKD
ncbi:MAG: DUF2240 family protein [Candidatus Aenigmatarchaeota archaeon]|nr:MAG: DUF2240 family protein [Candidatus Aenigmarchaeota archaeon]